MDERTLIRLARLGDQGAFEQLVLLKRDRVFRIAFNIVGDEDEAKDVAQMAFIRLWSAIEKFDEATGIPLVLNTSFNLKGEPIVATPQDALNTFSKSGMDILVLGNAIVRKDR